MTICLTLPCRLPVTATLSQSLPFFEALMRSHAVSRKSIAEISVTYCPITAAGRYGKGKWFLLILPQDGWQQASQSFFSLVLCGCACFPNVRAAVRELAVEFYDQYVGITDDSNAVLKEPMVHHFPTYIPEGYEIEKEDLTIAGGRIIYTNDGKGKIQYFQFYNKHATMYFDFEGAMLSDVFVNEYRGKYLEYTDERKTQNIIMWTDGTYTYYIIGELAYEELKMMAESVS